MDPIIFTDISVKLDETTIKENNIFIINNEKSNLGQIIYTLDLISNSGKNIIYLSSKNNFSKLNNNPLYSSKKLKSITFKFSYLIPKGLNSTLIVQFGGSVSSDILILNIS